MSVGTQPTVQSVNDEMSGYAKQLRDLMAQITDFNLRMSKVGATGLASLGGPNAGFSSAANPANPGNASDAQQVINDAAMLATVSALYFGAATQATTFNFHDALAHLRLQ